MTLAISSFPSSQMDPWVCQVLSTTMENSTASYQAPSMPNIWAELRSTAAKYLSAGKMNRLLTGPFSPIFFLFNPEKREKTLCAPWKNRNLVLQGLCVVGRWVLLLTSTSTAGRRVQPMWVPVPGQIDTDSAWSECLDNHSLQSVKHSCCDIIQQNPSNNWLTGDEVSSLGQAILGLHALQKLTGSWTLVIFALCLVPAIVSSWYLKI